MGKADLKKIPDKLTDAEKKKVKNDNVSIQISRVLLQLTPHFPALPPLLRTCTFRDRHLPHHPPPATSSWVSTGNTEHLSLSGTEHLSLSWSALPVKLVSVCLNGGATIKSWLASTMPPSGVLAVSTHSLILHARIGPVVLGPLPPPTLHDAELCSTRVSS
eukprot:CAMPEP_0180369812 /NCGR_PEP_ID=MMETSP0989-20121125/18602_1 /TAXON_ID=697907 /ORGANISM="non described non described, Strain CCMP2293" /LENGTH=160 /DNA_ID=CAMNT_0022365027 /DNA_START=589 /DNA_END=1072 /DNA_ORIENTATION=-